MSELIQINTSMDTETAKVLDQMVKDAGYENRSAFIRLLIRREAARQGRPVGEPTLKPVEKASETL